MNFGLIQLRLCYSARNKAFSLIFFPFTHPLVFICYYVTMANRFFYVSLCVILFVYCFFPITVSQMRNGTFYMEN